MNMQEYRSCVASGLKGKKLSKEERKQEFCIVSKVCSRKANDRDEAKRLCSLPKEPKLPKQTMRQRQKEQESCDPSVFFDVASQFNNLYVNVHGERCRPCVELDRLIKETDIPYQIVTVPEACMDIMDKLGIDAFPTVIKMSKGKIVSKHVGNPNDMIERMKRGE